MVEVETVKLLNHYDIHGTLESYHEHNKWTKLDYILDCLEGSDVALVSEAGTPGMSDPGYELIVACTRRGIMRCVVDAPHQRGIIMSTCVRPPGQKRPLPQAISSPR